MANEGGKTNNRYWRGRFLAEEGLFERMEVEGGFPSMEAVERWKRWIALDDAAFEAALNVHFRPARQVEPAFWRDARLNAPSQPVVGVCWYEARAYCAWLSAQCGVPVTLPSEPEWEASARGLKGRVYPYGLDHDPAKTNTFESHIRRTTPVGVYPDGRTPEDVMDLSGNVWEWTRSLWSRTGTDLDFPYPYVANDGREAPSAPSGAARVVRGGSWRYDHHFARAAFRRRFQPNNRYSNRGFRLVVSSPISPDALASGAV